MTTATPRLAIVVKPERATLGIVADGAALASVRIGRAEVWAAAERLLAGLVTMGDEPEAVAARACAALGVGRRRYRPLRARIGACRGCGATIEATGPGRTPTRCAACRAKPEPAPVPCRGCGAAIPRRSRKGGVPRWCAGCARANRQRYEAQAWLRRKAATEGATR